MQPISTRPQNMTPFSITFRETRSFFRGRGWALDRSTRSSSFSLSLFPLGPGVPLFLFPFPLTFFRRHLRRFPPGASASLGNSAGISWGSSWDSSWGSSKNSSQPSSCAAPSAPGRASSGATAPSSPATGTAASASSPSGVVASPAGAEGGASTNSMGGYASASPCPPQPWSGARYRALIWARSMEGREGSGAAGFGCPFPLRL